MTFPALFSEAKGKLRAKFRTLNIDAIEDSIQYARIIYWQKNIGKKITDDNKAFGWFLKVACNYLCNELDKTHGFCAITEAGELITFRTEDQYVAKDLLQSLEKRFGRNVTIVIKHAMGYTLSELAESEKISLDAIKQRHSRGRRLIINKRAMLEGDRESAECDQVWHDRN